MDLKNIISIGGVAGLHKVIAHTKNSGIIVESLLDKKRVPAFPTQAIIKLEDVGIYTSGDEAPLKEVLQKIYDKENGGPCIDPKKSDADLKSYFKAILPEYDEERVHISAIKKVLQWYSILHKDGALERNEDEQSEEDKLKEKNSNDFAKLNKASSKDMNSKPLKTAGSKVAAQGVRKTGVA